MLAPVAWIGDFLPLVASVFEIKRKALSENLKRKPKKQKNKHTYKKTPQTVKKKNPNKTNMIKSRTVCSQMFVFVQVIL